jgi:hypothetical protein
MVRFGADIPGVLVAIEAIALAGGMKRARLEGSTTEMRRDRQFGIRDRRASGRPTDGRTIRRVIQVGFGEHFPFVPDAASAASLEGVPFEVKEIVNRDCARQRDLSATLGRINR